MRIFLAGLLATVFIAVGGVIQGASGFGYSLVAVPLLCLYWSPEAVIPIAIMHSMLINILVFSSSHKDICLDGWKRLILILSVAGVIGTLIGTELFMNTHAAALRLAIGFIVLGFALMLWFEVNIPLRKNALTTSLVGLSSGILNGYISFSGPPVVIYLTSLGASKNNFRAILSVYFFALNTVAILRFAACGVITREIMHLTVVSIPVVLISTVLGMRFSKKISQPEFRQGVLLLLAFMGIIAIVSGILPPSFGR